MITHYNRDVNLTIHDIEALPNYRKRTTGGEFSSACPVCGGDPAKDTDRFRFWPEKGNYWCRQCEFSGFVVDSTDSLFRVTPEMKAGIERRQKAAAEAEHERHLSAIEILQHRRNDLVYHSRLNGEATYLKKKWGVSDETIQAFNLGYADECPTFQASSSFTIPYYWQDQLINLRHRLVAPTDSGKYRPEIAGLPSAIFNADILTSEEWVVLVEGEFKAMVLWQNGLPAIAVPGATNFKEKWVNHFNKVKKVFVALDPGADLAAWRIGQMLSKAGVVTRVATLPEKPDDMIVKYGCDVGLLCRYFELGRPV